MDAAALDALAAKLSEVFKPLIRETVREAVREEVANLAGKDMAGEAFFKGLNEEIMGRLSDIYREIASFQVPGGPAREPESAAQAGELMAEASERLDQVIQATEKATFEIIELVERNMSAPEELLGLLHQGVCDPPLREKGVLLCRKLSEDLVQIMTCLSFQDLTGQRIKRVIDMLGKVRDMVAELYVSTGILVKAQQKDPDHPLEDLKKDAKTMVSQAEVDDLLAQLNL